PSCRRWRRSWRDGHHRARFLNAGMKPISHLAPSHINQAARAQSGDSRRSSCARPGTTAEAELHGPLVRQHTDGQARQMPTFAQPAAGFTKTSSPPTVRLPSRPAAGRSTRPSPPLGGCSSCWMNGRSKRCFLTSSPAFGAATCSEAWATAGGGAVRHSAQWLGVSSPRSSRSGSSSR
ncbi:MAG: hypothetical protein RL685_6202, partial [Pseudomonadota bacterium]